MIDIPKQLDLLDSPLLRSPETIQVRFRILLPRKSSLTFVQCTQINYNASPTTTILYSETILDNSQKNIRIKKN